jgi:uncharacterized protein with von Willebrand factor type A (vWA) domain
VNCLLLDSFIHFANSAEIHEVDQEHVAQLDDAFKLAIKNYQVELPRLKKCARRSYLSMLDRRGTRGEMTPILTIVQTYAL